MEAVDIEYLKFAIESEFSQGCSEFHIEVFQFNNEDHEIKIRARKAVKTGPNDKFAATFKVAELTDMLNNGVLTKNLKEFRLKFFK